LLCRRARPQHPFQAPRADSFGHERAACRPTLRLLDSPRGLPRRLREDASSPTSATDISKRAPCNRSIPGPTTFVVATASEQHLQSPRALTTCRSAASDHLSAIRPRVEITLDGVPPASANFVDMPLHKEEAMSSAQGGCFPGAAFSSALENHDSASDAPCRAPLPPGRRRPSLFEVPGPLPLPPRQQEQLSRPEASSADKCFRPLARAETRHRSPGFATDEPASGDLSLLQCSRTKRLDP